MTYQGPAHPVDTFLLFKRFMQDHEIAAEIARRELEFVYLSELAASLGFAADEGWSEAAMIAIENATPEQRRQAALRTLGLSPPH